MSTHTFSITARRAAAKSRNGEERAYALASSTASSIAVTGDYLTREEFERLFEKIPVEGDEANSFVIKAKASLYTDGWLSAKGPAEESTSGSSGSSGIDLQAMWAALAASDTSKKISNTHLALHPLTINGTTYDPSSASAVVNITAHQEIHKLAFSAGAFTAGTFNPTSADASISVPTKTSHLTNDSGYVTSTSLNTAWADYVTLATAQTITGLKTFSQKIVIGSATIEWDSANSALKVSHSLYSEGWLSAKGAADGSSGSGSTSGGGLDTAAMWQALASADTSKKISNTHLSLYPLTINGTTYDPASASATISITASSLGALTAHQAIYDLTFSAGAFTAGTYSPKSAAKTISVPTHTSHLTNNSGFITASGTVTNAYFLYGLDERSLNPAPYESHTRNIYHTIKSNTADGLNDGGTYHDSLFITPWGDSSGGAAHNLGFTDNGNIWHRYGAAAWTAWKRLAFADDIAAYAPSLTGTGASGTWGISVSGNAASATKLQTARTIWGQGFDGTGNVSGSLTGVTSITASGSVTAANFLGAFLRGSTTNGCIVGDSENILGSGYEGATLYAYGNKPIYFFNNGGIRMTLASTYVGIGTTSPSAKLHVAGNGYFSGWLTAAAAASSSDMRLKRDIRERALTLGEMLAMRPVEFRWIGNGEGSYGAIAQEVEGVCPSLVHTDCQGYKSLAYGNLGVALGLSLARLAKEAINKLDDHEKRISKLETLCQ